MNYYADLASIFKELQIPWQSWFTLMDAKTGEVNAQVKAALGL